MAAGNAWQIANAHASTLIALGRPAQLLGREREEPQRTQAMSQSAARPRAAVRYRDVEETLAVRTRDLVAPAGVQTVGVLGERVESARKFLMLLGPFDGVGLGLPALVGLA
jgi:hypothetical protein